MGHVGARTRHGTCDNRRQRGLWRADGRFPAAGQSGHDAAGRTEGYSEGVVSFAADLKENLDKGDANYLGLLDEADAYVLANGLDLPQEPEARRREPEPACVSDPIRELDLAEVGITTIIWATGYVQDYSWLKIDAFDGNGRPIHQRGVSPQQGVFFLGLPWQSRRGSSFIWGVWHDAKHISEQIDIQRKYMDYHDKAQLNTQDA